MVHDLNFTVPGQPIGKGRPRFTRQGRAYTPSRTKDYEDLIRAAATEAMRELNQEPAMLPCVMKILAEFEIPKSWPKYKREAAQQGKGGYKPGKPDIDNIAKAVLDGCNGIAYKDDSLVYRLEIEKTYAAAYPALYVTVIFDEH